MPKLKTSSPALVHSSDPLSLGQLRCSVCSRYFKNRGDLNRHVRSHNPDTWTKCPYCDHSTAQKSNLDGHINKKHTHVKPHKCRWCPEQFADRSDRTKHQQRAHQEFTNVLESNADATLGTEQHSMAPVISTDAVYDATVNSGAAFTPISFPESYTTSFANEFSHDLAEGLTFYRPPPMTLSEDSLAAYPSFTFAAADDLDTPSDARSPAGSQPLSNCYAQHLGWTDAKFQSQILMDHKSRAL